MDKKEKVTVDQILVRTIEKCCICLRSSTNVDNVASEIPIEVGDLVSFVMDVAPILVFDF